ncbi:hypothetical protein B0H17DRAFT_1006783 [Mycena rosella]|uniref:DUF6534 domain-containing protein n=1 Tax=Mycena rosella TaxID=1033263 RepID=A0AAD7DUD6_MYCRO|nr:hypothetical protein B0H17DRAFT_1006783 [Mycena rosella]
MSSEIPPNIGQRTAPELFGMLFNYGLMGSLLVQVYHYYGSFPKDRTVTKAIVYSLFLLELTQTGIMSYFAYTIFGSGYGNLEVFDKSALEWFPVCILGSLIAGIVQLFYAYRLQVFSGSRIAGGAIALVSAPSSSNYATSHIQISVAASPASNRIGHWPGSAICDIAIAASMTFYLKRRRIRSTHLKDIIARLVRYTVETGAITAAVAVVQLVIFLAFPKNNFFETPSWTLGKLYSNNLLVLLNARAVVLGGRNYLASTEPGYVNEINLNSRSGISPARMNDTLESSIHFHNGVVSDIRISKDGRRVSMEGTQEAHGEV